MKCADEILLENESLKEIIQHKNSRIKILEDYIKVLKQKQFGASSEKQDIIQAEMVFTEAESTDESDTHAAETADNESTTVAEHKRKKKRVSIPKELPRVDVIHDLPDAEKFCPHDGAALKQIGSETHDQLDIIPATIQVLHHIRLKYACPCCEQHLITAQKPAQPIEKSIASRDCLPLSLRKSM